MAHQLVRIIIDEDGEETHNDNWHLVDVSDAAPRTLCSGEVFGYGEGNAVYTTKSVARGGITCPKCLGKLKEYKAIKL